MLTIDNFFQTEKVSSARHFARLGRAFYGPQRTQEFLSTYVYLRNLDNFNDNQEAPFDEVKSRLESELENVRTTRTPIETVNRMLMREGGVMAGYLAANIEGFLIDCNIISKGEPLPLMQLRERNKHHYLPGFQITSKLFFGREFDFGPQFERMGDAYIQYDALRDMGEDLPVGLFLFSQEHLSAHTAGRVVELQSFYAEHKKRVLQDLRDTSNGILHTNAPAWFKAAFSAYFATRAIKLYAHTFNYTPRISLGRTVA